MTTSARYRLIASGLNRPDQLAAKEALIEAAEALEWKPIETAPRDGTPLFVAVAGSLYRGHIAHNEVDWHTGKDEWGLLLPNGQFHPLPSQPSHWRPLPEPPETP